MWLTPDAEGGIVSRPLYIPEELLPHVSGALVELTDPNQWEEFGDMTAAAVTALLATMLDTYYRGNPMIGVCLPYANATIPDNLLPCDGSSFDRVDYQDLYGVIDAVYRDDPDTFHTPDLVARFVMGTAVNTGEEGGEASHTLTVGELASHGHDDAGHTHVEGIATAAIINGGLEAPAAAAIPIAGVTAVGYAAILPTGGDEAHNNLPPYHGMTWGIVWR